MSNEYKYGGAEFVIAGEMSKLSVKDCEEALERMMKHSDMTIADLMKDPMYLRNYWFISAENLHFPIRRCKRCGYFRVTSPKGYPFKEGICTKDERFKDMLSFSADTKFRCMHYVCKDNFTDKYPVTRNNKE